MEKEVSLNKALYKLQLYTLKVIPMVMAFVFWLNTFLSYFDIDLEIFTYLSSASVITLLYFYIASFAFKFCRYHRMFLHYVSIIWLIEVYDLYIGIPLSTLTLLMVYQIITGLSIFIILYLYVKTNKKNAP